MDQQDGLEGAGEIMEEVVSVVGNILGKFDNISILCWVFSIYEWLLIAGTIIILYLFIVGASLSAALAALFLLFSYTKHREDPSQDFFS